MRYTLLLLCACITFAACKHVEYVTVEKVRTDTLRTTNHTRDSIYLHDSIYMHEYMQGDTVFVVRDRWKTQYVDRLRRDTIYRSRVDSIPVLCPVEVVKEVAKPLSWWQQLRMLAGDVTLLLLAIAVAWYIFKIARKRIA